MKGCQLEPQPGKRSKPAPEWISMGSDCSGLGSDRYALRLAGVKVTSKFASEINPRVRDLYRAVHEVSDEIDRDATSPSRRAPVDLYVAGPPCQSWSSAGKRAGLNDLQGRGIVFFSCLEYVKQSKPKVVVFENVLGLQRFFASEFLDILTILKKSGYEVTWDVLNSLDSGAPQSRPRIYIVAIRSDCLRHKFTFPQKLPMLPNIEMFLDKDIKTVRSFPPPMTDTVLKNIFAQTEKLKQAKVDTSRRTCFIDVFASPKFSQSKVELCPCITATCGQQGGFYITNRQRMTTVKELGRLQGWPTECVTRMINCPEVSLKHVRHSIGNGMTVTVLVRLLPRALYCAGLLAEKPVDVWKHADCNKKGAKYKRLPDDMYEVVNI